MDWFASLAAEEFNMTTVTCVFTVNKKYHQENHNVPVSRIASNICLYDASYAITTKNVIQERLLVGNGLDAASTTVARTKMCYGS